MTATSVTLLSLGAGVQSTAIALLSLDGTLPPLSGAIFADTGWEPAAVYAHLERLAGEFAAKGVPLHRVHNGNIRWDAINPEHRYASVPYFVRNPNGSDGMGRRQCTSEYKLAPINRKVRELLGAKPPTFRSVPKGHHAEQWIGFSTDEIHRVSDKHGVSYVTKRYPLLDLGWSRTDCINYLRISGWSTTKSACIGCPYHGNAQWRALRDTCQCGHQRPSHYLGTADCQADVPQVAAANGLNFGKRCECLVFTAPEWDDAVAFDEDIRHGGARGMPLNGTAYLHSSRIPLSIAPIDRITRNEPDPGQVPMFDVDEDGDPDGCSPYGCRSGVAVEVTP